MHRMKISFYLFFCNLWSWTIYCIADGPSALLDLFILFFCFGWVVDICSNSEGISKLLWKH